MSSSTPLILGINGSPHKDGATRQLLSRVLDSAQEAGAKTEIIDLYDLKILHSPGPYSQDPAKEIPRNMPDDDMTALYPRIRQARGLVFATPTYWANMSGAMKDFIDRLTTLENDEFSLEGTLAACIAVSKENEGGLEMAAMSIVSALYQMGMHVIPNGVMWSPGTWHTAKGPVANWANKAAPIVGRNMVNLIPILDSSGIKWGE